jgi:hypothetical protein
MNMRMDRNVLSAFGPVISQYRQRYGSLGIEASTRTTLPLSPELNRMRPCLLKAQRAIVENPELLAGGPVVESPLSVLFNFTLPRILPQLIVGERVEEALQFLCEYSKDIIDQRGVEGARGHLEAIFKDLPDCLDLQSDRNMRGRNINHTMISDSPFRHSVQVIRDFVAAVHEANFMGASGSLFQLVFGDDLKKLDIDPQGRITIQFKPGPIAHQRIDNIQPDGTVSTRAVRDQVIGDQELLFLTRPVFEAVRTKIVSLGLEQTGVTDHFLIAVGKLENLESLALLETDVTDTGVKWLEQLKNLKFLGLSRTKVTADALLSIGYMNNLEILGMDGINLRVADRLEQLVKLQKLKELYLNNTFLMTPELYYLAKIKSLRVLSLNGNRLLFQTFQDVWNSFQGLQRLNISSNTTLEIPDIDFIRRALPNCEVNA